ncbi:MAG TPA: lysylphosphatidylglycerol synthase domain-containing protein [Chitinophagaceae bacterium]|jgi:hypothetical protein|nr:lysylphosphatidylglycerol synthase domain-containing protein [Chitinophagaceae bacterium]
MRLSKNIKIFLNYFLGPLLFLWLSWSIYRQIRNQPHLEASWLHIRASLESTRILSFFAALLLVAVNWGIEAWKWKTCVQSVHPVPYAHAFRAVLAGVSFSVTMPNRIGEYAGRIMYLPEGKRLKTIANTVVGSVAQLLVTLGAGTAGLLVLKGPLLAAYPDMEIPFQFLFYGLAAGTLLLTFVYFQANGTLSLFNRWIRRPQYRYLVEPLSGFTVQRLTYILLLSGVRYAVFLLQYGLLFYLFGVGVTAGTVVSTMSVIFLALAVIPSIALLEVGLRGEISLQLMGLFTANSLGVGLTTITVWFINLILPAIVGSLLILTLKMFNKKNEHL